MGEVRTNCEDKAMNHLTTPAQCALEWWRSGGERTKERLLTLVAHFAETNAESANVATHEQSALAHVKPWEMQS